MDEVVDEQGSVTGASEKGLVIRMKEWMADKVYQEELIELCNLDLPYEKLKNQSILITGGTGLICSYLTDLCMMLNDVRKLSIQVTVLCRSKERAQKRFVNYLDREDFHLLLGDVCRKELYQNQNWDYIIHGAGNAHPKAFSTQPVETMKANLLGTMNLLDYAVSQEVTHSVKKLLFLSTGEVYGHAPISTEDKRKEEKIAEEKNAEEKNVNDKSLENKNIENRKSEDKILEDKRSIETERIESKSLEDKSTENERIEDRNTGNRSPENRSSEDKTGEISDRKEEIREYQGWVEETAGAVDSMAVRSCYPESKRAAETLCQSYYQEYDVQAVVARLCYIYGAAIQSDNSRADAQFLRNAIAGEDIVMKSEGKQVRSYCYLQDGAAAIMTILLKGKPGEAYNVANKESVVSIREYAECLAAIFGVRVKMELPDEIERKGYSQMQREVLDGGKLETLGWRAENNLENAMKKMKKML